MPGISLPVVFVLQTALLIGAMVAIITSFVLVTNDAILTAVEHSIENNLNTFAESVATVIQEVEPAAKQAAYLCSNNWNASGRRRGDPGRESIADFGNCLAFYVSQMQAYPKFVYVYEVFEIEGSGGRFGELSCGYYDGLYSCTSTNRSNYDTYIEADTEEPLPLDFTPVDVYEYDPTEESYVQLARNMTAAEGHNETGLWQPMAPWFDDTNNESVPLITYAFPAAFHPVDGHTISAYCIDVDVAILSRQLRKLVRQDNLLYLVEVSTLALVVTSRPESAIPILDVSNGVEDAAWFTVPNTASAEINNGMRLVLDAAGGHDGLRTGTGHHVLTMDDTVVSYRHIRQNTLHWLAVDHTPRDFYFGEARRVSTVLIIVAVAVLLVCLVVCVVVYNAVVTPITKLATATDKIAKLESADDELETEPSLVELKPMYRAFLKLDVALKSFTRYVPRGVVKELIDSNELCKLAMTPRKCSILFSDIAGFTSISERVPAAQLSTLVHSYFNRMSRIVMAHGGMIDKFIGDCIMAVWGAPVVQEHHEIRATLAAMLLELESRSDPLASEFDEAGELLCIRVGVNSGDVLAGNMGSDERMNYTVIGDNVNLASRLEAFNKSMGTRVMVSDATALGLQDKFVLRLLCRVAVVGKDMPVEVFEVRGLDGSQSTKLEAVDMGSMLLDASISLKQLRNNDATGSGDYTRSGTVVDVRAENSSDACSVASVLSATDALREHRMTSLLKAARNKRVCDPREVEFCDKYTIAVRKFVRGECGDAIARLTELKAEYPEWTQDNAAEYLEAAASRQLANPDPAFDGVFRATEK